MNFNYMLLYFRQLQSDQRIITMNVNDLMLNNSPYSAVFKNIMFRQSTLSSLYQMF